MEQELLRGRGFARRIVARRKCRDAVLFSAEFVGLFWSIGSQAFGAGAEPAAADEERCELDSSGGAHRRSGGAEFVSARRTCRASHAQRSSGTEPV